MGLSDTLHLLRGTGTLWVPGSSLSTGIMCQGSCLLCPCRAWCPLSLWVSRSGVCLWISFCLSLLGPPGPRALEQARTSYRESYAERRKHSCLFCCTWRRRRGSIALAGTWRWGLAKVVSGAPWRDLAGNPKRTINPKAGWQVVLETLDSGTE